MASILPLDGLKTAPSELQAGPREALNADKMTFESLSPAQEGHKTSPRDLSDGQEGPKTAQGSSKTAQEGPKTSQEGIRGTPSKARKSQCHKFRSEFLPPKTAQKASNIGQVGPKRAPQSQ